MIWQSMDWLPLLSALLRIYSSHSFPSIALSVVPRSPKFPDFRFVIIV
jgi:hypothetical protein